MKLFHKHTTDLPTASGGRRRLVTDDTAEKRPQAFSYYAQRSTDTGSGERQPVQPDDPAKKSHTSTVAGRNPIITSLVGVGLLAGIIYCSLLSYDPAVRPITSHGSAYFMQSTDVYRQQAARVLASSIFNHSKFTIDTARVSQQLTTMDPEIKTASVTVPFFGQKPIIKIQPYDPSLILVAAHGAAFLLDTNGRALVSASQISENGELSVPVVQDLSATGVHVGSQALSASFVDFILQMTAVLHAAKISYGNLVLLSGTSEVDVPLTGSNYYVKFNLQEDARLQAGTFLATRLRLQHDKVTPAEYIDVRLPGRAYYK